jgi:hypothetical protein
MWNYSVLILQSYDETKDSNNSGDGLVMGQGKVHIQFYETASFAPSYCFHKLLDICPSKCGAVPLPFDFQKVMANRFAPFIHISSNS